MGKLELLTVFTVSGVQPIILLISKAAIGAGFTQMVFVIESFPQTELPTFNLIVYVPGTVKFMLSTGEPGTQSPTSWLPKSFPKTPLTKFHPVAGDIFHTPKPELHTPF